MKKKAIALLIATSLFTAYCMPVLAAEDLNIDLSDENIDYGDMELGEMESVDIDDFKDLENEIESDDEEEETDNAISYNDLLNAVQTSSLSGGVLSLSECLSSIGAIDTTFDEMYSLAQSGIDTDTLDMGLLNYSFDSLSDSLLDTYDSIDLSGMSEGCMQLFYDTYGDLVDELSFSPATIPSGFDIDGMLDSAASAINNTYSSATSSGTFETIKDSISIGSIFAQAAAGPTTTSLAFADSSVAWFNDQTASNASSMYSKYSENFDWYYNKYQSYDTAARAIEGLYNYRQGLGYTLLDMDANGNLSPNEGVIELTREYVRGAAGGSTTVADENAVIEQYRGEIIDYLCDEYGWSVSKATSKLNKYEENGENYPQITGNFRDENGALMYKVQDGVQSVAAEHGIDLGSSSSSGQSSSSSSGSSGSQSSSNNFSLYDGLDTVTNIIFPLKGIQNLFS